MKCYIVMFEMISCTYAEAKTIIDNAKHGLKTEYPTIWRIRSSAFSKVGSARGIATRYRNIGLKEYIYAIRGLPTGNVHVLEVESDHCIIAVEDPQERYELLEQAFAKMGVSVEHARGFASTAQPAKPKRARKPKSKPKVKAKIQDWWQ